MSASSLATNASSYLPLQDSVCPQEVGVRLFDGVQEGVGARTSIDDKTAVQRCNVDEQRARASSQQHQPATSCCVLCPRTLSADYRVSTGGWRLA